MGKDEFKKGSTASATEFAIDSNTLTPPTATGEVEYLVKYNKTVTSGAKITITADKNPKAHELFFKALAVDPCDKENYKPLIIHIPEFIPSPELSLAIQGGDSQTLDYNGAILADICSTAKTLVEIYFIDEAETV